MLYFGEMVKMYKSRDSCFNVVQSDPSPESAGVGGALQRMSQTNTPSFSALCSGVCVCVCLLMCVWVCAFLLPSLTTAHYILLSELTRINIKAGHPNNLNVMCVFMEEAAEENTVKSRLFSQVGRPSTTHFTSATS